VNRTLRIGLAQVNPTVGDLWGNSRLIVDWIGRARDQGVDIVCFPELAITGYPPEDLVLKPAFVRDNLKQLDVVALATKGISAVVGFVDEDGDIFNAAAFLHDGELKAVYHKVFLPNYGVFDEQRYFTPGHRCPIFEVAGVRIGVSVCEDCWYPSGPMAWQAAARRRADAQHQRLALPRGQARAARGDDRRPRKGLWRLHCMGEHCGRPGRAGLRWQQRDLRTGLKGAGACIFVPRGAPGLRRESRLGPDFIGHTRAFAARPREPSAWSSR